MKKKSIGVNAVLNSLRTVLSIIFPLITFPYVSRILGVENLGRYNFAHSIVNYAALFAALGVHTYSIRECARYRNDREQVSKNASEIFSINMVATLAAYLVMFSLCFLVPRFRESIAITAILSVEILFVTLGCEWIYSVYEDYLYITLRSLAVHILSLVLLFVFVKTKNDLIVYAVVSAVATSGAAIANWIGRGKYAHIRLVRHLNLKKHLKPILTIFANTVTTSIYVHSDVLILGLMSTDTHVGLYTVSTRIYTIIKRVIAAVITVSVPRLSHEWGNGRIDAFKKKAETILLVLFVLSAPAMVGLFALSEHVVLLISGAEYLGAATSLRLLSIALLFSVFCWFYTSCILIPTENERYVLRATIVAAVTNVVLNIVLIPSYFVNAVAFTTVLAELISLVMTFLKARETVRIRLKLRDVVTTLVGSVIIFPVCQLAIRFFSGKTILIIAVSIPASVLIYVLVLLFGGNSLAKQGLCMVKTRLHLQ